MQLLGVGFPCSQTEMTQHVFTIWAWDEGTELFVYMVSLVAADVQHCLDILNYLSVDVWLSLMVSELDKMPCEFAGHPYHVQQIQHLEDKQSLQCPFTFCVS